MKSIKSALLALLLLGPVATNVAWADPGSSAGRSSGHSAGRSSGHSPGHSSGHSFGHSSGRFYGSHGGGFYGGWPFALGLGLGLGYYPYYSPYYDYPYPIYPSYPIDVGPVAPPVYYQQNMVPPVYYDQNTAPPPALEPAQIVPQSNDWYYCREPKGYYPYVRKCKGDWQRVPSQPPGMPR